MFKRFLILTVLVSGFTFVGTSDANAWVVHRRRIAPVRRAVLPPYPIARRVVAGPVYRPFVYRRPVVVAPAVTVGVGYGGYVW